MLNTSLNRPVVRAHSRAEQRLNAVVAEVLTAQWFGRIRENGNRYDLPMIAVLTAQWFGRIREQKDRAWCPVLGLNRPVVRAHSREPTTPQRKHTMKS